jgi:hypothetical protein
MAPALYLAGRRPEAKSLRGERRLGDGHLRQVEGRVVAVAAAVVVDPGGGDALEVGHGEPVGDGGEGRHYGVLQPSHRRQQILLHPYWKLKFCC